jgi:hypothetical protein
VDVKVVVRVRELLRRVMFDLWKDERGQGGCCGGGGGCVFGEDGGVMGYACAGSMLV